MPYRITDLTLGELLQSEDTTIRRNAMSILKVCQRCNHEYESSDRCIYCFKPDTCEECKEPAGLCECVLSKE